MTAEITGTTVLPNGETAAIWVYADSTDVDTNYVYVVGDTVRATGGNPYVLNSRLRDRLLVTPFVVGNSWRGQYFSDTVQVVGQGFVSTPAGQFADAFLVARSWGALNDYGSHQSWFAPGVGLVKKLRQESGWWFYGTETWELVSYDVVP
jgi:hypothetical protein